MWCIKIRTGAFVARRHGKIFITGNSGFPKSMNISKAIDKTKGVEGEVVGISTNGAGASQQKLKNHERGDTGIGMLDGSGKTFNITAPASPEAKQWSGWGTCLKPAVEPIVLARKPIDGTVANNVLKYGTGGLNIDACRVPTEDNLNGGAYSKDGNRGNLSGDNRDDKGAGMFAPGKTTGTDFAQPTGRFPANFVHDGSDEVLALFPDSNGSGKARILHRSIKPEQKGWGMNKNSEDDVLLPDAGSGSAARFFYCAKASTAERGEGNDHPTVKPVALMKYLVKMVCRRGGTVLDPFCGSGTTGIAAIELGDNFIGIERDEHYCAIAKSRVGRAAGEENETAEL